MIALRFLVFVGALLVPIGHGISAQETEQRQGSEPGLATDAAANAIEQTEKKKILVMIEQAPNRLRPGASYASGYGSAQTKIAREGLGRAIAQKYGFEFVELWPMPLIELDCFIFTISDDHTVEQAVEILENHPGVEWAEPMEVYQGLSAPAGRVDPLTPLSPAYSAWNLTRLHSSWTGRNVSIAVIDTQVDVNHPDLEGRVKVARNFAPQAPPRPEYHGTEVAGIIAANARNGIGIAGIAPRAQLLALRACWQRGAGQSSACTSLNLARAMSYAIESGAKIINLSLGGPSNRLLSRLIDTAQERGIAVVAAYDSEQPSGGFPASHPGVIGVSQLGVSQLGVSAGRGYAAPGREIPTLQPGGRFNFVSGSSYSAAHVSGLLALKYERSRNRRDNWQALGHTDSTSREIDIAATFE